MDTHVNGLTAIVYILLLKLIYMYVQYVQYVQFYIRYMAQIKLTHPETVLYVKISLRKLGRGREKTPGKLFVLGVLASTPLHVDLDVNPKSLAADLSP